MPRGNGKRYDESFKKETVKYIAEKYLMLKMMVSDYFSVFLRNEISINMAYVL